MRSTLFYLWAKLAGLAALLHVVWHALGLPCPF